MMLRAVALPSRSAVIVNLSNALRTLVGLERQAFNLGDGPGQQRSRRRDPRVRRPPQSGPGAAAGQRNIKRLAPIFLVYAQPPDRTATRGQDARDDLRNDRRDCSPTAQRGIPQVTRLLPATRIAAGRAPTKTPPKRTRAGLSSTS